MVKRRRSRILLTVLTLLGLAAAFIGWQARSSAHNAELNRKLVDALRFSSGGNIDDIKRLIHQGADPNISSNYPKVDESLRERLQRLLFHRPVPTSDCPGTTPLMVAAGCRDPALVKELLQRGSNPNARNHNGETALYGAVFWSYAASTSDIALHDGTAMNSAREVVRALLEAGADPNAQSRLMTDTPFQRAIHFEDDDIDNLLLQYGAKWNIRDGSNETAFPKAARHGRTKLVRRMLAEGANPNEVNQTTGFSAYEWAELNGRRETASVLLQAGANINLQGGPSNFSPLMRVVKFNGTPAHVQRFLEIGARVDAKDRKGRTALDFARKRGDKQIIQFLEAATRKQTATSVGQ